MLLRREHNNINFPCCSILMIQVFVIYSICLIPPLSSIVFLFSRTFPLSLVLYAYNFRSLVQCPLSTLSSQYPIGIVQSPQNGIENISISSGQRISQFHNFTRQTTIKVIDAFYLCVLKMNVTQLKWLRRKVNNIFSFGSRTVCVCICLP